MSVGWDTKENSLMVVARVFMYTTQFGLKDNPSFENWEQPFILYLFITVSITDKGMDPKKLSGFPKVLLF